MQTHRSAPPSSDVVEVLADSSPEWSGGLADVALAAGLARDAVDDAGITAEESVVDGVDIPREMVLDTPRWRGKAANVASLLAREEAGVPRCR